MISYRINNVLSGYKRTITNTEQFSKDLSNIDKLVLMINDKKNFYRVRNKFLECVEYFNPSVIDDFIIDYYDVIFDEESMELYQTSYKNIIEIYQKRS